jgi:hypothetical protein
MLLVGFEYLLGFSKCREYLGWLHFRSPLGVLGVGGVMGGGVYEEAHGKNK